MRVLLVLFTVAALLVRPGAAPAQSARSAPSQSTPEDRRSDRNERSTSDEDSSRERRPRPNETAPQDLPATPSQTGSGSWSLCNASGAGRIDAIIAWQQNGRWQSSRWQRISGGECLIARTVPGRYVYFYASNSDKAWSGTHALCTRLGDGTVTGTGTCSGGLKPVPFRRVLVSVGRTRLR